MKKFLKKLTEQVALNAFSVYKDRKIQKARDGAADIFNKAVEKSALSIKLYVLALMAGTGFCSAGIVLVVLGFVLRSLSATFGEEAANCGFWTLICSGGAMIVVPIILYLFIDLEKIFRKQFADDLEKKIRGK